MPVMPKAVRGREKQSGHAERDRMLTLDSLIPGEYVLAAVSGGADSVALLLLLWQEARRGRIRMAAAHFEHGLRGEASLEDARFVEALCMRLGVPCVVGHGDVAALARDAGMGVEEAARQARYSFLRKEKQRIGADCVALAHHADDQAETVLMHLFRGASLDGAAGMRVRRGDLYRPLLYATRREIEEYLTGIGQDWRTDETNLEDDTPRNLLRNRVLPLIEAAYPGARAALGRFARWAALDADCLSDQAKTLARQRTPFGWILRAGDAPRPLILRALADCLGQKDDPERAHKEVQSSLTDHLRDGKTFPADGLPEGGTPSLSRRDRVDGSGLWRAAELKDGGRMGVSGGDIYRFGPDYYLVFGSEAAQNGPETGQKRPQNGHKIAPNPPKNGPFSTPKGPPNDPVLPSDILDSGWTAEIPGVCRVRARGTDGPPVRDDPWRQVLDARAMEGCSLRLWRAGDRIQPFGMKGEKLMSDYFQDRRVNRVLRAHWPVLARGDEALWVPGLGISEKARCQDGPRVELVCEAHEWIRFAWEGKRGK